MQLWFYKAKFGDYQDKLIAWWSKGLYSHVELYFEQKQICFSSSLRDHGVRFKKINSSDHWDVIKLDNFSFNQNEEPIYKWCESQVGLPYDILGIIGLGLDLPINERRKWYCSEIVATALNKANFFEARFNQSCCISNIVKNTKISPNKLFLEFEY